MNFLLKNKVVIIGVLTAIALAVSELVKGGDASIKVIVFSGIIAGASWIARNLRGQAATIIGLVGNAVAAYLTMMENGTVSYAQLIIQFLVSFLAVLAAPPKSAGYEKAEPIVAAKKEGEAIQPSSPTKNP